MTRSPLQQTRVNRLQLGLIQALAGLIGGSWRRSSLQLLALLLGFYAGSNVTTYVLDTIPGGRPAAVLLMVVVVELVIRLRSRLVVGTVPMGWVLCDNVRLGAVYAVVLEAFKLGT